MYYYKLNPTELREVAKVDAAEIERASKERKPGQFAYKIVKVYLNKARTIWVQSIHCYGGEHFGRPYHFVAEVAHATTHNAFTRCLNRLGLSWVYHKSPFTY